MRASRNTRCVLITLCGEPLATDRQIHYLNDLSLNAGWKLHVFEDAVTALFELDDFSELTKQKASDLITWLHPGRNSA